MLQPNRILYITNVDMNNINGATEHINGFIAGIKSLNMEIKLLSLDKIFLMKKEINKYNKFVQIILLNLLSAVEVINSSAEVIYIRYAAFTVLPLVAAKIRGKLIVLELNGSADTEIKELFNPNVLMRIIIAFINSFMFGLSNKIVVVTEQLKKHYESRYPFSRGKIIVSSNCGFATREKRKQGYSKRGIYLATRNEWGGFKEANRISRTLKEHGIELEIWNKKEFTGGDYDFGLLIYNNSTRVTKYGFSPIKYFTYLSYGIPAIVPNYPDINKITEENEVGLVYYTKKEIIGKILSLYEAENYEEMSGRAYNLIQSKYNWQNNAREIMKWINA